MIITCPKCNKNGHQYIALCVLLFENGIIECGTGEVAERDCS